MRILLAALLLASTARAATEVAPGVTLVPGGFVPGSQPDGNSVVLDGPKGLVVVDTGRHAEHTQAILDVARAAKKPIVAVVNTHWHLDHVGGNPMVRHEYPEVRVYASDAIAGARKGFLADYQKQLEELVAAEPDAEKQKMFKTDLAILAAGDQLVPDEKIAASGARTLAGRKLDVHLETYAVTAGDVWLFDPATRTLVAGDLVTLPAPFLDTACPARWQKALDGLAKVDFKLLIPGHGPPMTKSDFATYRTAFAGFLRCGASGKDKATCVEGWLKDAGPLLGDTEPKLTKMLADYYVESALRGKPERTAKLCGKG
jgi:glyoxylase-like metal-dependent hydrolase (beta-lactamase superfamily II)